MGRSQLAHTRVATRDIFLTCAKCLAHVTAASYHIQELGYWSSSYLVSNLVSLTTWHAQVAVPSQAANRPSPLVWHVDIPEPMVGHTA
jgi:hypothetical protein